MIQSLKISNFKSLKDVEFELPSFAALIGYNAAGKSNLLKAVHLISLLAEGNQVKEALAKLNLLSGELLSDESNPRIRFSIKLLIDGNSLKYTFTILQEKTNDNAYEYKINEEKLTNGSEEWPILSRVGEDIKLKTIDGTNQGESQQLVSSRLAMSLIKRPHDIAKVQTILSRIIVQDFDPSTSMQFGSATNIAANAPKNLTEQLYDLFKNHQDKYLEAISQLKSIIPGIESINIQQKGDDLILNFQEYQQRALSILSSSFGNVRTTAIVSAMFSYTKPSALFIDEIENSFHPERIKSLVKFLDYYSAREKEKIQVVFTTHNPVVLDFLSNDQVIYVYKKDGFTKITNPYNNEKVWGHLQRNSQKGATLGELFKSGILEGIYSTSDK